MKTLIISITLYGSLAIVPVMAQQTTGSPGSPSAATTIDGKQLPPPDPKFEGVTAETIMVPAHDVKIEEAAHG